MEQTHRQTLDSFIDEIIYVFEVRKYDIVIFEDLDRFNEAWIFEDLRRINNILNSALGRDISFIYAVRDDIFIDSINRTKFFDFIVHIVPVSSRYNIADYATSGLSQLGYDSAAKLAQFSDIIKIISKNIYDLRELNDIFNAFVAFRGRILEENLTWLKPEKLLAMLVFRSQFPGEFDKIRTHDSVLDNIFERCGEYADEQLELQNKLLCNILNPEQIFNAVSSEIRDIYEEYQRDNHTSAIVQMNGEAIDLDNFDVRAFVGKVLDGSVMLLSSTVYSSAPTEEYDFKRLEDKVPDLEHAFNIIINKEEEVRDQIKILRTPNKFSLIDYIELNDCLSQNSIEEQKLETLQILIKELLSEELIDESYQLYTSRFLGVTHDKMVVNFNINYVNVRRHDFGLLLQPKQILAVLESLDDEDLQNPALFNCSIIDYLINQSDKRLNTILDPYRSEISVLSDFFVVYYSHCALEHTLDRIDVVLKALIKADQQRAFSAVLTQVNDSDTKRAAIVAKAIQYSYDKEFSIDKESSEVLLRILVSVNQLLDNKQQYKLACLLMNSDVTSVSLASFTHIAQDHIINKGMALVNLDNILALDDEQIQRLLQNTTIEPSNEDLLHILESGIVQPNTKVQILNYIDSLSPRIFNNQESQLIMKVYLDARIMPSAEIFQALKQTINPERLIELLLSNKACTTEDLLIRLRELPGEYWKFTKALAHPVLKDSPVHRKLINELRRRSVISSSTYKDGMINIHLSAKKFDLEGESTESTGAV